MDKLLDFIEAGRKKLVAERNQADLEAAEELEYRIGQQEQRRNGMVNLVPDCLRQYVSIQGNVIHIDMPDCARVSAKVYLRETWLVGRTYFEKAELTAWTPNKSSFGIWMLSRYGAYDGEISLWECGELHDELDVALARAVEFGDGKAEAEAEAARQSAEFANWNTASEEGVICPLMSTAAKHVPCLMDSCAWFVTEQNGCAHKPIALGTYGEILSRRAG